LQNEELTLALTVTIFSQICSALTYIHDQNLVHGLVSSHAIQLVTANFAKLGNFEYMIDKSVAFFLLSTVLTAPVTLLIFPHQIIIFLLE